MCILNCSLPHDSADRHSVVAESPSPRKKSREELIGESQTLILASLKCHGYLVSLSCNIRSCSRFVLHNLRLLYVTVIVPHNSLNANEFSDEENIFSILKT